MEISPASNPSTPTESEATMGCQLRLTSLAGNEVAVSMNIAQFDRFDDFEEHIVDYTWPRSLTGMSLVVNWISFTQPRRSVCRTESGMPCKRISALPLSFESAWKSSPKEGFDGCAYRD